MEASGGRGGWVGKEKPTSWQITFYFKIYVFALLKERVWCKNAKKTEIVEDQQENREASFFGWIKKHVDLSSSTAACRGEGKVMDTL